MAGATLSTGILDSSQSRPHLTSMRVVIIGTGGRVGGALARHFRLAGHAVMGFDHKALDLTRPEIIRDRLLPLAFDTVLLPAALTSLDYAEEHPDEARLAPGIEDEAGRDKNEILNNPRRNEVRSQNEGEEIEEEDVGAKHHTSVRSISNVAHEAKRQRLSSG